MPVFNTDFDALCEDLLCYLYETVNYKYSDANDTDSLVQDCMMAFLIKIRRGETVEYPKAFLATVLRNKYNDMLRKKYKNNVIAYNFSEIAQEDNPCEKTLQTEEYEEVRHQIGKLIKIYREVTVLYYVQNMRVEQIAEKLSISKGTVMSRLANARTQIKEGLQTVEKYSTLSYAPKNISISIWGSTGLNGEPFSLIHSPLEANILILAYENPVSVRGIADSLGVPSAYIEPIVDTLVEGELLGRTTGGLVYSRIFMQKYEDSFGDILAQETLADKFAEKVWSIAWKHLAPFTKRASFENMSEKQKATLVLFLLHQALVKCIADSKPVYENEPSSPPKRANGGVWLATATIFETGQERSNKYDSSGPVIVNYSDRNNGKATCRMYDCQSLFGDAHWAYQKFQYKFSLQSVLRFYASLLPCDVKTDNELIYELVPEFEKLNILHRNNDGKLVLDIPALDFDEMQLLTPITTAMQQELQQVLAPELEKQWQKHKVHIPKHVDCAECYRHASALGAYAKAQMVSIVKKGLMPYSVQLGQTPLIFVVYQKATDAVDREGTL